MKGFKNISPAALKLNLTVAVGTVSLLVVSLAVMMYFSLHAIRQEAMLDAEQTLAGTVQNIDNILLSIEQTSDNVYHEMLEHINQPELMEEYCRRTVESNPYIAGCAIVFKPNFYQDRELFMAYMRRGESNGVAYANSHVERDDMFGDTPYTEQVWFTQPMETGQAGWLNPLKGMEDSDEAPIITFSLPFLHYRSIL